MRSRLWATGILTVLSLLVITVSNADESSSTWPRSTNNQRKSNKPKKYKCVLIDDDDSDEVAGFGPTGGGSYVSELQQRRVQAANSAAPESAWPQRPSLIRPQAARTYERTIDDNTRPLKQITLNRPAAVAAGTLWPAENVNLRLPSAPIVATTPPSMQLSEQYCQMIKQYATIYQVTDTVSWVHKNCAFAKMYLPNATCDEIDLLVASCYRL